MFNNIATSFLASTYSGFSPLANSAAATCTVNGQSVPCDSSTMGMFFVIFGGVWIVMFVLLILTIVSLWKIFVKAGRQGWAALVPVYNIVVLLEIVGKPTWWVILAFIPFVNLVVGIIVLHQLAKVFGKGIGFTFGLIFLSFIFYPILGFGKSTYMGAGAAASAAPASAAPSANPPVPPPVTPSSPQATL